MYMSPVSTVFHTVVTARLISKMSVTYVNKTGLNLSCSTDLNYKQIFYLPTKDKHLCLSAFSKQSVAMLPFRIPLSLCSESAQ